MTTTDFTTAVFAKNLQAGDKLAPRGLREITEVRVIGNQVTVFTKGSQFTFTAETAIKIL